MKFRTLLTGVTVLFLATGTAHAKDFCRENKCSDYNGKICYKMSNCCKNPHDWATEIRDKTICKQKR
jgi:hypothetical protein